MPKYFVRVHLFQAVACSRTRSSSRYFRNCSSRGAPPDLRRGSSSPTAWIPAVFNAARFDSNLLHKAHIFTLHRYYIVTDGDLSVTTVVAENSNS